MNGRLIVTDKTWCAGCRARDSVSVSWAAFADTLASQAPYIEYLVCLVLHGDRKMKRTRSCLLRLTALGVPPPLCNQAHVLEQKQLMMPFPRGTSELDSVCFSVSWPCPAASCFILLCSSIFHRSDVLRNVLFLQYNFFLSLKGSLSTPFHFLYIL